MTEHATELDRWTHYLTPEETPTYGTYEQRAPEYDTVANWLMNLGLKDDDLIVDVGAGSCDFDHYLRTSGAWRGRYLPIDGATIGINFNERLPYTYLPNAPADWYVAIETLEHIYDPERVVRAMRQRARKGMVVTTPNARSVDVIAVDPTHVIAITPEMLYDWGFTVHKVNFCDRGTEEEPDTLVGVWIPATEEFLPEPKDGN